MTNNQTVEASVPERGQDRTVSAVQRLGIIGFGPIGRRLAERFVHSNGGLQLAALLVRERQISSASSLSQHAKVFTDFEGFIDEKLDVIVECASPQTLANYGTDILAAGCDLIPLSLGALADKATEQKMAQAARVGPGRLEIPAGALGSIGFLAAGRENNLSQVKVTVAYPIERWRLMGAGQLADLDVVTQPLTFLRSTVREVAQAFPGHLNILSAAALAGLGFDKTEVELVADPTINQAWFKIDACSDSGPISLMIGGRNAPVEDDPIDYTTFSIIRLLLRRIAHFAV